MSIIKETGYAPNAAARSLKSARTGLLALVVHDITNPIYAEIVAGAQAEAAKAGEIIMLGEANSFGNNIERVEKMVAGGGVDGLILQGAGTEFDDALQKALNRKLPIVFMQSGNEDLAPVVRMDDRLAGRLATQHLIDNNHQKIGMICTKRGLQFSEERLAGWRETMLEAGLDASESLVASAAPEHQQGYEAAAELLNHHSDLTALVVGNSTSAMGVMAQLYERGILVPDDMSIVAIHDVEFARFSRPSLTTIAMPLREMAAEAVRIACNYEKAEPKQYEILDPAPYLIERSSVTKRP